MFDMPYSLAKAERLGKLFLRLSLEKIGGVANYLKPLRAQLVALAQPHPLARKSRLDKALPRFSVKQASVHSS